ncbi:MATE family efflux transporter [Ruminococcus sp. HUN007]|uniref:MATE family efflux transporter n=1 Tax=Ruminococcus sp. HUN007 TaxID=1514668 RepID=UPI000A520ADE
MTSKKDYLAMMRNGEKLSLYEQLCMIITLSIPAIMAQVSSIVMQYTDAAMIGHLSPSDSAAIGLVSSTTWLFGGICSAASIGFTVQIAHLIGAGEDLKAQNTVKSGLISVLLFSMALMITGIAVSSILPHWLGGAENIRRSASGYFMIYAASLPFFQLNHISAGMLQCSGNMKLPSTLNISKCFLDVIYNFMLIFPSRTIRIFGSEIYLPGAGLGIYGAALGTALAEITVLVFMLYALLKKSDSLHLRKGEKMHFSAETMKQALRISFPVAVEQLIVCSAYIASTKIVSPLGTIAIAAHSFSITAESLCYMPGYGIGSAATTITGQCIGAGRSDMTKKIRHTHHCDRNGHHDCDRMPDVYLCTVYDRFSVR